MKEITLFAEFVDTRDVNYSINQSVEPEAKRDILSFVIGLLY